MATARSRAAGAMPFPKPNEDALGEVHILLINLNRPNGQAVIASRSGTTCWKEHSTAANQ